MNKMKNIIISPPRLFDGSKKYLDFISKLISNKSLAIEIIKSMPLIVTDPVPISTAENKLGSTETILQHKLLNMHADKLVELIKYFQNKGIQTDYAIGFKSPQIIKKRSEDLGKTLLWVLEVSSENNIWNQLMGTKETKLAKQVDLPCLCIPSDYAYIKPKSLLIITNGSENINKAIPIDIINKFELETTLLIINDSVDITNVQKYLVDSQLQMPVKILTLKQLSSISTSNEYIETLQPSWIAYHDFDKSTIERVFNSNTNEFILSAKRPILVM